MKIKNLLSKISASGSRRRQQAFSLIEVTVGMGVMGTCVAALMSGFTTGFFTMQLARENQRATQIMMEKTETLRLYNWDQVNTAGFIQTSFTNYYDPNSTNKGIAYTGTMTITNCPISSSYSNDMRMVTVAVAWKTGSLSRNRSLTTYVARNGIQSYIY